MSARRWLPWLGLALTLGACSLLRSDNWLKVHDKGLLPFEVGKVTDAKWLEYGWSDPSQGEGIGFLIMLDQDMSCSELLDAFGSYAWLYGDGPFGGASGMLAYFAWWHYDDVNAGFEGLYATGGYAYSEQGELERRMLPLLIGDGQMYLSYGGVVGVAEITSFSDSTVEGTIGTDLVDATFSAENCGKADLDYYYYYDDDWYYYESAGVTP